MQTLPVHLVKNSDGTYDKRPACGSWAEHKCQLGCFGTWYNAVGIRLDDITVLDIDKPDILGWLLEQAFDLTQCVSKTPRGYHLYFSGKLMRQVSGDGWDLKHGAKSFVVAPSTVASDQAGYLWISKGTLGPVTNLNNVFAKLQQNHPQRLPDLNLSHLSDPTQLGGRNNFLAGLKGWLIAAGCNSEYVARVIVEANRVKPEPISDEELNSTVLRDKVWT